MATATGTGTAPVYEPQGSRELFVSRTALRRVLPFSGGPGTHHEGSRPPPMGARALMMRLGEAQ